MNLRTYDQDGNDAQAAGMKYPEGRQFTAAALNEMGLTPGDVGEFMQQLSKNSGITSGGRYKAAGAAEQDGVDAQDAQLQQDRADEQRREQQARQDEEHRRQQQQQADAQQQKTLEQKQFEERQRADGERANNNITGGVGKMVLASLALGLAPAAVTATGNMLSGALSGVDSTAMVASNNGGGMLGALRNVLGIGNPAQPDQLLTGANQTVDFIPGQAPQLADAAPGAPALGNNPLNKMNQIPGMTPKGMA